MFGQLMPETTENIDYKWWQEIIDDYLDSLRKFVPLGEKRLIQVSIRNDWKVYFMSDSFQISFKWLTFYDTLFKLN